MDSESKVILGIVLFSRYVTAPVAAFLQKFREKHDLSGTEFLVDQFGYRTALSRVGSSDRGNCTDRNLTEKWSRTLKTRIDRFHNS